MKILIEFVNGESTTSTTQHGNTHNHHHNNSSSNNSFHDPQEQMDLIASCLQHQQHQEQHQEQHPQQQQQQETSVQWQWWLGRLSFIRRLFDEHHSQLLLASPHHRINMSSSLPVSPNSDVDLREFLNSLAENLHAETKLAEKTCQRILLLARFAVGALSVCQHSKVHKHALFLIIKCIAVASQDGTLYPQVFLYLPLLANPSFSISFDSFVFIQQL